MNLKNTTTEYARIVADSTPLACARRMRFDSADDFRAVLSDLAFCPTLYEARKFFELAAEAFTLEASTLPPSYSPLYGKETTRRAREWSRLYRRMAPLVPVPADTPWEVRNREDNVRMCCGYKLSATYVRASKRVWGKTACKAHWRLSAHAAGVGIVGIEPESRSKPALLKQLEAWAREHPIAAERLARAGVDDE